MTKPKLEIIHLSNYAQPSGVKIQIRALKVKEGLNGYPFSAERSSNGCLYFIQARNHINIKNSHNPPLSDTSS